MVTEEAEAAPMTREEIEADLWEYREDQLRIRRAILTGMARSQRRLSKKEVKKIDSLVRSALDALPHKSGLIPLSEADIEFVEGFARTLAKNIGRKR